jgi:hypothetical protein
MGVSLAYGNENIQKLVDKAKKVASEIKII